MDWRVSAFILAMISAGCASPQATVRQLTSDARPHSVGPYSSWTSDDSWIVYTCGPNDQNDVVERIFPRSGKTERLYQIPNQTKFGPGCGTASVSSDGKIVMIHGPSNASPDRKYEFWRRSAAMIDPQRSDESPVFLDARDVTAPFTEGALRGGTHCHQFNRAGNAITFTYNDMLVSPSLRTIGVSKDWKPVHVDADPENHYGAWFAVLLVSVKDSPEPGSGKLSRAYENCWVEFPDGRSAVAFKGDHLTSDGTLMTDLFLVDVPEAFEACGPNRPLAGTEVELPFPPKGAELQKLTDFSKPGSPVLTRKPRFWLSASLDGAHLFFLGRDADGVNQVYSVSTADQAVRQLTRHDSDVESSVSVHNDGQRIAYVCDGSVFVLNLTSGKPVRVTPTGAYSPQRPLWSHGDEIVFYGAPETGAPSQLFIIETEE